VFFSLTASSGEDVPRNLEFLLSRNRLNVAVSRARCLAYVVASPRLLEVACRSDRADADGERPVPVRRAVPCGRLLRVSALYPNTRAAGAVASLAACGPTVRQVYALAAALCERAGEEFPASRAATRPS
jgi:hypothetical protein